MQLLGAEQCRAGAAQITNLLPVPAMLMLPLLTATATELPLHRGHGDDDDDDDGEGELCLFHQNRSSKCCQFREQLDFQQHWNAALVLGVGVGSAAPSLYHCCSEIQNAGRRTGASQHPMHVYPGTQPALLDLTKA